MVLENAPRHIKESPRLSGAPSAALWFLLAVVQPDNRMFQWVDHFLFNNRHLTQMGAEYGRICNMIYGVKELCLWIILSCLALIMNQPDIFRAEKAVIY